jgi:hypothetical protein
MVQINLRNRKYTLKTRAEEISFNVGVAVDLLLRQVQTVGWSEQVAICALLSDLDESIWIKLDPKYITQCYNSIEYIQKPSYVFLNSFVIDGVAYAFTDLNHCTVAEYAELERCFNDQQFERLIATLYRRLFNFNKLNYIYIINSMIYYPVVPLDPRLNNIITVTGITDYDIRTLSTKLNWQIGLGALIKYLEYRSTIATQFNVLFEDPIDHEPQTPEQPASLHSIWGIYSILADLSQTKMEFDYWLTKPITELFTYLTYIKQKNIYRNNGR